ncbi:MAG: type III-A CRISPR-associated RAMP protein Csm5 [Candidatus Kapaibacteriota bacterium]
MAVTLWLRTLTPVHIGTGNKVSPEEYYFSNNKCYRINLNKCFFFLGSKLGYDYLNDKLNEWSEHIAENFKLSDTTKSRAEYKLSIFDFVKDFLKNNSLSAELRNLIENDPQYCLYCIDSSTKPWKEVVEIIKLSNKSPYIPGSSLKGVFRTALLYTAISENLDELKEFIKKATKDLENHQRAKANEKQKGNKDLGKKLDDDIVNHFFVCESKGDGFDPKYDLLKFVSVCDAYLNEPVKNPFKLASTELLLINARKQPQTPIVEFIKKGLVFKTEISVDFNAIKLIASQLKENDFIYDNENKDKKIWIDFKKKFNRLFKIDVRDLIQNNNPLDLEKRIVERIMYALRKFSKDVLQWDLNWLGQVSSKKTQSSYSKHISDLENVYNQHIKNSSNIFKIGWASGFTATTVFLALRNDPNNEAFLKNMLSEFIPKQKKKDRIDLNKFPTSRRLAYGVSPIGWLEFSPNAFHSDSFADTTQTRVSQQQNLKQPSVDVAKYPVEMKLTPQSKQIPAEVVDNSSKPIKIRLLIVGYEKETFHCSGVDNLASIPPGTKIFVNVSDYDKKKQQFRMFRFEREIK